MAVIVEVKSGKYVYLYHQLKSWREKDGSIKNKRVCVGKIDSKTGKYLFKADFIKQMKDDAKFADEYEKLPRFSVTDIECSTIKGFGLTHFLARIADEIGLKEAIFKAVKTYAEEIYTLAVYLVANGDPFMHTKKWIETVDLSEEVDNMTSDRVSRILQKVKPYERDSFFREWARIRTEEEYLALDITSTSSYSELIEDVSWGYNRDGESLPQINICLLLGETSSLPVYQVSYPGALKDLTTLQATLKKFDKIAEGKTVALVMDKGFCTNKNVESLLADDKKFVIAVPFTNNIAKKRVKELSDCIDTFANILVLGSDILRVKTSTLHMAGKQLYVHAYFNPMKYSKKREECFAKAAQTIEKARNDPESFYKKSTLLKYLSITKSNGEYAIAVDNAKIEQLYVNSGWLILMSNHIVNPHDAIRIYRNKDVVEKGFLRLKNSLDLGRLSSDEAMQNKLFIGFISLVMLSKIHITMCEADLYKKYTLRELLDVLAKQKLHSICGERIEIPRTKEQRLIFEAFGF